MPDPSPLPLLPEIWQHLSAAITDPKDPWRLPALASLGPDGAAVRTVVLRQADPASRQLVFYTDARSPKVAALRAHPRVEWLFWHPGRAEQLRAVAHASLVAGTPAAAIAFDALPPKARHAYLTVDAPGAPIPGPADGLPSPLDVEDATHFLMVVTTVTAFDWTCLVTGQSCRAHFSHPLDAATWTATWHVP